MTDPFPGVPTWPGNYRVGCRLTASYIGLDASAITGGITLSAKPSVLLDYAAFKIIVPRGFTVPLVAGALDFVVPATDDPDVSPQFWTYTIVENWPNGRTYSIEAPMGQTVDLVNASPVAKSDGTMIVRGPAGTGVVSAVLDDSDHLILTMSDGSVIDAGGMDIDGGDASGTGPGIFDGGGA